MTTNLHEARMAMDPCAICGQRGHHRTWHDPIASMSTEDSNRLHSARHDLECAECGHTYPGNMATTAGDGCACCVRALRLLQRYGTGR